MQHDAQAAGRGRGSYTQGFRNLGRAIFAHIECDEMIPAVALKQGLRAGLDERITDLAPQIILGGQLEVDEKPQPWLRMSLVGRGR
jgi:hypothetical protein